MTIKHACASCGAALSIPDQHDRWFKCQYCGTVLEDRSVPEPAATGSSPFTVQGPSITIASGPVVFDSANLSEYGERSRRWALGFTILVFVMTFGIIGAVFWMVWKFLDDVGGLVDTTTAGFMSGLI